MERVIRAIRKSLKKPVFLKGIADWLSELPSVVKKYKNSIHSSMKMKPVETSKIINEKEVYSNLHDIRVRYQPKFKLGNLTGISVIISVFSKGDNTNYSYELYSMVAVKHDTIPSYRINYLSERYNENLLLPTKLSLDENNQVMKKLILIQLKRKIIDEFVRKPNN